MYKAIDVVGLTGMRRHKLRKLWEQIKGSLHSVDPGLGAVCGINLFPLACGNMAAQGVSIRVHTDEFTDIEKVRKAFKGVTIFKKGTRIAFVHVKAYPAGSAVVSE